MTAGEYEVGHLTLFSDTAIKGRELQESGRSGHLLQATLQINACPDSKFHDFRYHSMRSQSVNSLKEIITTLTSIAS